MNAHPRHTGASHVSENTRQRRVRPERSLDVEMIRFVLFVGIPLVTFLAAAGGVLSVVLSQN